MNQEKPWWDDEKYNERMFDGLMLKTNIAAIVAEAERRGREKALEEVGEAAINTVVPLSVTLEGPAGTETVEIVAIPKSFFKS